MWCRCPHPRAALPQQFSWAEQSQQGLRPLSLPRGEPCATIMLSYWPCHLWDRGRLQGAYQAEHWSLQAWGALIKLLHGLSYIWKCNLSPLPHISGKTLLVPFVQEEWIWIQLCLCLWYLLLLLLVLPKLGYKISSFPFSWRVSLDLHFYYILK